MKKDKYFIEPKCIPDPEYIRVPRREYAMLGVEAQALDMILLAHESEAYYNLGSLCDVVKASIETTVKAVATPLVPSEEV